MGDPTTKEGERTQACSLTLLLLSLPNQRKGKAKELKTGDPVSKEGERTQACSLTSFTFSLQIQRKGKTKRKIGAG